MNIIQKYSVINFDDKVKVFKTNGIITNVKIFDKIYPTIPEETILEELEKNRIVRFIYLSLRHRKHDNDNAVDEFFYIGQHRATSITKVLRYFGSGKIVRAMHREHPEEFEKCYLMICESDDDMNEKEKSIVTEDIINMKPYCLNLVDGGNQVNWIKYKSEEEVKQIYSRASKSMRKYHTKHPEKKYKMRKFWKQYYREHPEMAEEKSKRKKEYYQNKENRKNIARKIKEWSEANPDKCKEKNERSRQTYIKKYSQSLSMYDLDGYLIKNFDSPPSCSEYIVNNILKDKNRIVIMHKITECLNNKIESTHGFQFKHFEGNTPKRIKPTYNQYSFVVYTNEHKPIYIFHSAKQFHNLISPYIKIERSKLMHRIIRHIQRNTPYFNLYYKHLPHISSEELEKIIKELKDSKETDILKYIDFNQTKTL